MYCDLVFVMFILFLETNIGDFIGRLMSLDEDCAAVDLSFTIDEVFPVCLLLVLLFIIGIIVYFQCLQDETSFPIERNDNITYNCSYSFTVNFRVL